MDNKFYKKNKEKILLKCKEKRKNRTIEEIQKEKEYQKNYWKNIKKKKLDEEFKKTGTNKAREYYKNNIKPYKISKRLENPKLQKKEEYNKIDFN
jgi:hypothetical protein